MDINQLRILLVDDEKQLLSMLIDILRRDGFENIITADNAGDALRLSREENPQALILDVMLPDGDGFTLFEKIRRFTNAPVLFLSARDEDEARLRGLGLGADDYIVKPFLPKELTLRLRAVLRRAYQTSSKNDKITLGQVQIDLSSGVVYGNGDEKALTAKEYALIQKLSENRGRIVTVDSLCAALWQSENIGYDNTLMVHMRRLREKIELDPSHPKFLITVRGLGYRLLGEDRS